MFLKGFRVGKAFSHTLSHLNLPFLFGLQDSSKGGLQSVLLKDNFRKRQNNFRKKFGKMNNC